jgi:hypothetical protein
MSPAATSYRWSDTEIRFIVPEFMIGGLVTVETKQGESREVICFTNRRQMPVVVSGPLRPGEPYISRIEPERGAVGDVITLSGLNFGLNRGSESNVQFAWVSGESLSTYTSEDALIAAREIDYDYVAWTDREIQVRVPDGATTGNIRVSTDKGDSNAAFFEVDERAGKKLFSAKVTYILQRNIDLKVIRADKDNGLYLFVPRILETSGQRNFQLISIDPEPFTRDFRGFMIFYIEELEQAQRYSVAHSVMFDRFEVESRVVESRLRTAYDKSSRLYQTYTNADALVPSTADKIADVADALVRGVKSPYTKAWRIYDYVVARLSYAQDPEAADPVEAIDRQKGDARTYAVLFSALARNAGIPARPVAGYIVTDPLKRTVRPHFWAEFYLERIGWLPVDPLLGDGLRFGDFPSGVAVKSYYFGNMDNRHIALMAGLPALRQMNPNGRTVKLEDPASFQPVHEESVGNLRAYSSNWSDIEILGIY